METQFKRPTSVAVIGWASVLASGIMTLVNIGSLVSYGLYETIDLNLPMVSQYVPQGLNNVLEMYRYSRLWTVYGIFYFLFVLVAGIQFLRLRAWGRTALEIACWIGLFNAVVDTWLSYAIWQNMQEVWTAVMRGLGGGRYPYLNPLGFITIIAGFFMWVIPCAGMIFFLRTKRIKESVNLQ